MGRRNDYLGRNIDGISVLLIFGVVAVLEGHG
jgi:hypothetical protein